MIRQYQLVEEVKAYDPSVDESMLNRAYVFSLKAHGTQKRASGDPYFSHPLEVAGILTGMKLDSDTIVTGLLHDTVEDTVATIDEIRELFGEKIAELVDGVTKLSRIEMQTESERQAENFRKFVLAMSNDIRVLLVKLADRLHNMRTLGFINKPEKRRRIALETMEIFAPLAERIGMHELKDELQELAFRELNPEANQTVLTRLQFLREEAGNLNEEVTTELKETLAEAGIEATIIGREKRPYSIWQKMQRQHIPFEQLSDVMAFRVIVDDIPTCYRALGIVHARWAWVHGRFKDYISTSKPNGYRSLHTTVIGPRKMRIEIQIRTEEMHQVNEIGVAAHWQYKQQLAPIEGSKYRWVRELLEILDNASSPEEFLEHTKLEMFADQVFCFTPKGDLVPLPRGSTAIDFAYAVHTEIGNQCVGAKVNGRLVPLRHQLENGDQVEILTSSGQTPSPRWENFAFTGKARSSIRRFVRQRARSEYAELGKTILEKSFKSEKLEFAEKTVKTAAGRLGLNGVDDAYASVGSGELTERDILRAAFPGIQLRGDKRRVPRVKRDWSGDWQPGKSKDGEAIPIKGLTPGMAVHLSDCCHPLPGDRIVGILSQGKGVMVHTIDCEELEEFADEPERWLDLSWQPDGVDPTYFAGRLKLVLINESGALADIATIVAKQAGNISNLKIVSRDPEFFTFLVDVEVKDVKHLNDIVTAMRASRLVSSAERVRG